MLHHKNTKHIAISLFVLFTVFSVHAQLPKLIAKNEKAVFQIRAYNENGICYLSGTGFFIDNKGTCITALHLLSGVKYASIKDQDGNMYPIQEITGVREDHDMVEFKIASTRTDFPFISYTSKIPEKGAPLFIIGNPEDYLNSVTTGILSAVRDEDGIKTIQTTAPISQGSSGSPLMNMKGQAIGVVSYGYSLGQNLNFAYSMDGLKNMEKASGFDLEAYQLKDVRFVNQVCKTEPFLILHSIELTDTGTVLNCSYTNISIAFGDGGFIYSNIGDTTQCMFLRDKQTGKKFYITSSSLAGSPNDAPGMKLGERTFFKMYFPPIGNIRSIDIGEAMKGGNWTFNNVIIPEKAPFDFSEIDKFNEASFEDLFRYMHNEYYEEVVDEIEKLARKGKGNERTYMLAAAASFASDDLDGAIMNTKQALEKSPGRDLLHADLSAIYLKQQNLEEALFEINKAIELNDEYIDYFNMRADILYEMENWSCAIEDYDRFKASGRTAPSDFYLHRGIAKAKLKDPSACADLQLAKDLAGTDREWDNINKEVRKYCK